MLGVLPAHLPLVLDAGILVSVPPLSCAGPRAVPNFKEISYYFWPDEQHTIWQKLEFPIGMF